MLSISKNPQTSALQDRLSHSVGSVLDTRLGPEEGAALLVLCSLLPDDATVGDLVAASAADMAEASGVPADLLAGFLPVRTALQNATESRCKAPLFDLFLSEVRLRSTSRDGPPTHFATECPTCGGPVAWPVNAGSDLKDRPLRCEKSHVFALSNGKFV